MTEAKTAIHLANTEQIESQRKIMQIEISKSGTFCRQVSLEQVATLPGHYCLQFKSTLASAADPNAIQRSFEAILYPPDLLALRDLLASTIDQC